MLFQYQALAEPIAPVGAERTQLDKWWEQSPTPPRQLARELYGHSEIAQVIWGAVSKEVTQLGKWWRQNPDPVTPLKRLTDRECLDFVSVTVVVSSVASWAHFYPDYLRPMPRLADRDEFDFGGTPATPVEGWAHFYPDYLRPTPRLTDRDEFDLGQGVFNVETTSVDRWAHFYPDWIRPLPRLADRDEFDFGGAPATPVEGWAHFYPDYLRPTPRLADRDEFDFGGVPSFFLDGWQHAYPDYLRPTPRLADRDEFDFGGTPATPVEGWAHFYPDYLRPSPRLTDRECLDFVSVLAAAVNVDAWEHFYPDYLRPTPRLADRDEFDFGEGVFNAETTSVDRWYQMASLPVRPAYRVAPWVPIVNDFRAVFVGIFNPASGFPYEQTSEPPRALKRLPDSEGLRYGEGVFVKETTSLDRWWQPTSLPVRAPQRQSPFAYSVVTTEITSLDKWWQPASLPIRLAQRIVPSMVGTNPFIIAFSPATGFPWQQASEPTRPLKRHWLGDYATTLGVYTVITPPLASYPDFLAPAKRRAPTSSWSEVLFVSFALSPQEQTSEPPRWRGRLPYGDFAFGEGVFNREVITLDKWLGHYPAILFPPKRIAPWAVGTDIAAVTFPVMVQVMFRKTLSNIGTRTGVRQKHAWDE